MNEGEVLGSISQIIETYQGWLVIKFILIIGIIVYCFFAFSVFRQTQLMDKVLKISIRPSFRSVAFIYLLLSIIYLLLALVIL